MLPPSYQIPAAALLVIGGTIACFAGYRLFRVVLAIYGFILGAMLGSSVVGVTNTVGMVIAALVGGIIGAALLTLAYFAGIALVGAGVGALLAHVAWGAWGSNATAATVSPDPPAAAVIVLSILGAVGAMLLQRYVIILSTAFGGAWTLIVGGLALSGNRGAVRAASAGSVWILYPMNPAPGERWIIPVWVVLGVVGTGVQLAITGRKR
jgi:hypothetical protein